MVKNVAESDRKWKRRKRPCNGDDKIKKKKTKNLLSGEETYTSCLSGLGSPTEDVVKSNLSFERTIWWGSREGWLEYGSQGNNCKCVQDISAARLRSKPRGPVETV